MITPMDKVIVFIERIFMKKLTEEQIDAEIKKEMKEMESLIEEKEKVGQSLKEMENLKDRMISGEATSDEQFKILGELKEI